MWPTHRAGSLCLTAFAGLFGAGVGEASPPPMIGPLVDPTALELPPDEPGPCPAAEASVSPEEAPSEPLGAQAAAKSTSAPPFAVAVYDPPTEEERQLIEHAIYHCDNASERYAKPFIKLALLRTEREAGLPDELRGITLAAWCGEAAYQTGDIVGDRGSAVGILQLHPFISSLCGSPDLRYDPIASAQCWLWNLKRVYRKARRLCPTKYAWKAAELWLSQGGKKSNYSCKRVSGHVARLERWQRAIERANRIAVSDGAP